MSEIIVINPRPFVKGTLRGYFDLSIDGRIIRRCQYHKNRSHRSIEIPLPLTIDGKDPNGNLLWAPSIPLSELTALFEIGADKDKPHRQTQLKLRFR